MSRASGRFPPFPVQPVFSLRTDFIMHAVHRASIPGPDINSMSVHRPSSLLYCLFSRVSFILLFFYSLKTVLANDKHTLTHSLTRLLTQAQKPYGYTGEGEGEEKERKKETSLTRAQMLQMPRERETKAARANVFKELFHSSE